MLVGALFCLSVVGGSQVRAHPAMVVRALPLLVAGLAAAIGAMQADRPGVAIAYGALAAIAAAALALVGALSRRRGAQ